MYSSATSDERSWFMTPVTHLISSTVPFLYPLRWHFGLSLTINARKTLCRKTQISAIFSFDWSLPPPWGHLWVVYQHCNDIDDTSGIYLMMPSTLGVFIAFLLKCWTVQSSGWSYTLPMAFSLNSGFIGQDQFHIHMYLHCVLLRGASIPTANTTTAPPIVYWYFFVEMWLSLVCQEDGGAWIDPVCLIPQDWPAHLFLACFSAAEPQAVRVMKLITVRVNTDSW